MERFAFRMLEVRERVVRLLMWEVGKSLQDSQKEFDRTVKYINDTIGALKDLDRVSSRFTIEEGIIGQIRRAPMGVVLCMGPDTFPFTGRKDSAEGTLPVSDALRVFSIRTLVAAKQTDLNKQIITRIVRERKSKFLATDFIL